MEWTELDAYLINRPSELKEAQKNGRKIVGYFPGNYVPEEIIYAAEALPVAVLGKAESFSKLEMHSRRVKRENQ